MRHLVKLALRGAGAECGNLDAEAFDFCSKTEREDAVKGLGGGVGGDVRNGLKAGRGGDDENPSAAARDHGRNEESRDADDGFAVDAHLAQFLLFGTLVKTAVVAQAGVVDEDFDGDTSGSKLIVNRVGRAGIVQIGRDYTYFRARAAQLGGKRFKPVASARGQNKIRAVAGQLPRQRRANARAGSCDQRPLALELRNLCHGFILLGGRGLAALAACLGVQLHAQLPGGAQRAQSHVFIGRVQPHVGCAVASPAAGNGQEDIGSLGNELRLLLGRQHQVAIALLYRCERGKNAAAHAEVHRSHVRAFLGALKAQRQPFEILRGHWVGLRNHLLACGVALSSTMLPMAYFLFKTEPDVYSFDDFLRDQETVWDGVTNPTAVKHLREMKPGTKWIFYHTGDERTAVGTGAVVSVDATDPKVPIVRVKVGKRLKTPKTLAAIKAENIFAGSPLVVIGRLSVVPLTAEQWEWFAK